MTTAGIKGPDGTTDLGQEELHEKCYKHFYKVWSAYTKYLKSQVIEKEVALVCNLFGVFTKNTNITLPELCASPDERISYIPSPEFVQGIHLSYAASLPTNLPCMDLKEIKMRKVIDQTKVRRTDFAAIAKASDVSEHSVLYTLK